MPRPPREDYPGAFHHVYNRGARRAPIFKSNDHCYLFLHGLNVMVEKYGVEIHGYALMPNHFHLLFRSHPEFANLSRAMGEMLGRYCQRVNELNAWDGPVFRGRFKSQPVKDEANLLYLLAYIHLNPVRAHLVKRPDAECWTSHRVYAGLDKRDEWLTCGVLRRKFGGSNILVESIDKLHRGGIAWPNFMDLKTGWFDWSEAPVDVISGKNTGERLVPRTVPQVVKETLREVKELTGSSLAELRRPGMGPGANPARRFAVWALWETRMLTHAQIGKALVMSTMHVSKVLSRLKHVVPSPIDVWQKKWKKMHV